MRVYPQGASMSREFSSGKILQLAPLMPVVAAFAVGILVGGWFLLPAYTLYVLIILSLLLPAFAFFWRWRFNFFISTPMFFFLGLLFISPFEPGALAPGHIARGIKEWAEAGKQVRPLYDVTGLVMSEPVFTGRYTRLNVAAQSIVKDGKRQKTAGGVRLSVRGETEGIGRGDTVRFLGRLKAPHNFGNPGEFDYVRWLHIRGIEALGSVRSPRWIIRLRRAGPGVLAASDRARKGINGFISASGAANPVILKALVTGDKSGLSPNIRSAFSRAGVAHVLAISGLHVGIVAFFTYSIIIFFLKLCPFLTLRVNVKKTALIMSLFPVVGYGFMAGFSRPTERAVIMAAALIVAVILERGKSYYNTLALAAMIILVIAPASIYEASFQLSFLAVFFILYISPLLLDFFSRPEQEALKPAAPVESILAARCRAALSWSKRRALDLLVVTIAASLGTWPLVAYYFNHVSTVGILTNLIILPITTVLVEALFLSAVFIPISATLARWGFHIAGAVAGLQLAIIKAFAGMGFSSIHLSRPAPLEVFFIYVLILSIFGLKRARFFRFTLPISAVILITLFALPYVERGRGHRLRVTFISVGQGDASLIEFPKGSVMLIDGGGFRGGDNGFDTGKNIIAPLLRYKKIGHVNYMVLSHAQQDHMGGLGYVADNFPVGKFWWNGRGDLRGLGETLVRKGIPLIRLGMERKTFLIDGVRVGVLPLYTHSETGLNDSSLALRLTYGARSFLFTGDMEAPAEGFLSTLKNIRANVLKAPHHGSDTSSTTGFLRAVRPDVVVISVGRWNRFGFPARQSLDHYAAAGARVLRTDRDGAVEVSTDGSDLEVKTFGG